MDKSEIISKFRRELCHLFGYGEDLKLLAVTKSPAQPIGAYAPLNPRDFLTFAVQDSVTLERERNRVNCLGNCKRAIDAQVDALIGRLGFFSVARKQRWKIPKKFDFISQSGIVTPRILSRVSQLRNRLEHEFAPPSRQEVEDALDIATLFI